jgi:RimJ/RimL family protein N-acetyltransferase
VPEGSSGQQERALVTAAFASQSSGCVQGFRIAYPGGDFSEIFRRATMQEIMRHQSEELRDRRKVDTSKLRGSLVRLRLLQESDLHTTLEWRNQDHIRFNFVTTDIIEFDDHKRWFERYLQKNNEAMFVFETLQEPIRIVGQIGAYNIDHEHNSCEIGRLIVAEQRRGYGLDGYKLLIKFIKEQLGISNMFALVRKGNVASESIQIRCGFVGKPAEDGLIRWELSL